MKKIIFICSGNTCRSPMAENIFNNELKKNNITGYIADSAGLFCHYKTKASDNAISVLKEIAIDLTQHLSKQVTPELLKETALIIPMTENISNHLRIIFPEKTDKIKLLKSFVNNSNEDICDPFGGDINEYRKCRDMISECIKKIIDSIKIGNI